MTIWSKVKDKAEDVWFAVRDRIIALIILLMLLFLLAFIGLVGWAVYSQYEDTKDWQGNIYEGDLKDIPPVMAKNYIWADDQDAIQAWQEVTEALAQIDENGGISEYRMRYEHVLKESKKYQDEYEITSGEIVFDNQRLALYLELEAVLENAYKTPSAESLTAVTNRLYDIHMDKNAPVHAVYFEKLQKTAADYQNLSVFLEKTMPKLGTIDGTTLIVDKKADNKLTDAVAKEIEEKELRQFPVISQLYSLLKGGDWMAAMRQNDWTREYQKWKDAQAQLQSAQKSQFYSPSGITTYQQAKDAGLFVRVREQAGYTVDPQSPVVRLEYKGVPVKAGQYIRHGTPVTAVIEEQYIEIPKPEEAVPKEEEPPKEEMGNGWEQWGDGTTENGAQDSSSGGNSENGTWDEDW